MVLFAKAQNNLLVYSFNGDLFKLSINKNIINLKEQASVLVTNVEEDTLMIEIQFSDGKTVEARIYLLEKNKQVKGKEFNYKIEKVKNKPVISFAGINEILQINEPLVPQKPVVDTSYRYKNNILGHFCELKEGTPVYFNNIPKTTECQTPMPDEYMNYLKQLLLKDQTPDEKYTTIEMVTRNNCISILQILEMLKNIDYEVEKLKLLKISYYHITDKSNSTNLENAFKFESSKKELHTFLNEVQSKKQIMISQCERASSDKEITTFAEQIKLYGNDAERYQIFKKLYTNYCYSTAQAKQVLITFIHDREKLEAAQLLYYYCTDRQNYETISDIFSYKQTESDLKDFIEKQN